MFGSNDISWISAAKRSILSLTAALALITSSSSAQAQWNLVDDFEGLAAGATVNGTNGGSGLSIWDGGATYTAEVDPSDATNSALQVLGLASNQVLRGQFAASSVISAGDTGTLYYRFRTPDSTLGGTTDSVTALTDNAAITNFNFKAGLRNTTVGINNLDARNGGSYEQTDLLQDSTWYSIWMVATNTDPGTHELYLQSDTDAAFATQTKLDTVGGDVFDFRVNGPTDIINVYFRGAGNAGGTADSNLYFDDVWVNSSARDLSVPSAATIPEPTGVAVLLSGMGMLLGRRRRR